LPIYYYNFVIVPNKSKTMKCPEQWLNRQIAQRNDWNNCHLYYWVHKGALPYAFCIVIQENWKRPKSW